MKRSREYEFDRPPLRRRIDPFPRLLELPGEIIEYILRLTRNFGYQARFVMPRYFGWVQPVFTDPTRPYDRMAMWRLRYDPSNPERGSYRTVPSFNSPLKYRGGIDRLMRL